ncbi:hypothetical protein BK006_00895 [bacterium CG10_49_38]|nr:MAG: hypothetical protein BK006_00895 [bacterium CG10_49_38]
MKLPIGERQTVAEGTERVVFGLSGKKFPFIAGQHLQVAVSKLLYPDPRGRSRVFSIASSPGETDKIAITFRFDSQKGSGFKRTLLELPLGSLVEIEGPFGYFTLPDDLNQSVVFIAGGIGITPFLSMIRFAEETRRPGAITLLYANRAEASAAFLAELRERDARNTNFSLKNKFGPLGADFVRQSVANPDQVLWYVAGPGAMVSLARQILFDLHIPPAHLFTEEFEGY